jgi:hypothetical protein
MGKWNETKESRDRCAHGHRGVTTQRPRKYFGMGLKTLSNRREEEKCGSRTL